MLPICCQMLPPPFFFYGYRHHTLFLQRLLFFFHAYFRYFSPPCRHVFAIAPYAATRRYYAAMLLMPPLPITAITRVCAYAPAMRQQRDKRRGTFCRAQAMRRCAEERENARHARLERRE